MVRDARRALLPRGMGRAFPPGRPRDRDEVRLYPSGSGLRRGERRRRVVAAEQPLVEQRRVPLDENAEIGNRRVSGCVMADDLGPGAGDGRVVLLRRVRGQVPDPDTYLVGGLCRSVAAGGAATHAGGVAGAGPAPPPPPPPAAPLPQPSPPRP